MARAQPSGERVLPPDIAGGDVTGMAALGAACNIAAGQQQDGRALEAYRLSPFSSRLACQTRSVHLLTCVVKREVTQRGDIVMTVPFSHKILASSVTALQGRRNDFIDFLTRITTCHRFSTSLSCSSAAVTGQRPLPPSSCPVWLW